MVDPKKKKNLLNLEENIVPARKIDKYEKLEKAGVGRYGVVYKCRDKQTGQIFALKKTKLEAEDEGIPFATIREISLLKELQHINIVKLYDVIHMDKKLFLVFEYLDQDLRKFIDNSPNELLEASSIKSLLYQLLKGVQYIHKFKILHRDLKPQNLLISKEETLKIADFGLARDFGIPIKNYTNEVVTLWYRSPDVLLGSGNYLTSIDIWSVGCIFAEMVTGKPLFSGVSDMDQLKKIFKIRGTPNENYYPQAMSLPEWKNENFEKYQEDPLSNYFPELEKEGLNLLTAMLQMDPDKRISATDALSHPYFNGLSEKTKALYQ